MTSSSLPSRSAPTRQPTTPQRLRAWLAHRCRRLLWLCALASLSAPLARKLYPAEPAPWHWLMELAAHWQWLYLAGGLLAVAGVLLGATDRTARASRSARQMLSLAVAAGALVVNAAWQASALPAAAESEQPQATLTVATANLNLNNTDFAPLLQWLGSDSAPDVVFLQEFTSQAQQALQHNAVQARYPHRLLAPQPDPFGLALLSRHPLAHLQTIAPSGPESTLQLRAQLAWQGDTVHLSALHPMPPVSARYAQVRDAALRAEAAHLAATNAPALLAGDLNTTPWTQGLFAIAHQLQRAHPARPSWPNASGWLSVLPLDHVLASPAHWRVSSSVAGPDLGSDHRPQIVHLQRAQP